MRRYLDRRLKFRHLRVIEAVSAHRSLVKAASALCLTQPALTRSLQEIEDILGVRLFERHAKGVTENRFGQILSQSAKRILAELNQVETEFDKLLTDASGTLVVGALPVAAAGLMPGVLARLKVLRDDLHIRLVQGLTVELLPQLSAGNLDLIVGRLYPPETADGLVRETLYHEPISILARIDHPMFAGGGVDLAALKTYKLVLPTTSTLVGRDVDDLLGMLDLDESPPLRSSSIGFIREVLQSTDFITVMPQLMMAGDLLRGQVRVVPLPVNAPSRPAGLIYRPDRTILPGAQALIETLRTYVKDVMGQSAMAA